MFEPFAGAPSVSDVLDCVRKQLSWHSELQRRSGADGEERLPPLYVMSTGRPTTAIVAALPLREDRRASYAGPTGFRLFIVVLSELPRSRATLLLRLLGAGRVLRKALGDLMALPDAAWEKCAAVPWLVHFGFELPAAEEELSVDIQAWFKSFREKVRDEGRELALSRLVAKRLNRALTDREARRPSRSG